MKWNDGYIRKRDCYGRAIIRLRHSSVDYITDKRADLPVGAQVQVCVNMSNLEVVKVVTPDEMSYMRTTEHEDT